GRIRRIFFFNVCKAFAVFVFHEVEGGSQLLRARAQVLTDLEFTELHDALTRDHAVLVKQFSLQSTTLPVVWQLLDIIKETSAPRSRFDRFAIRIQEDLVPESSCETLIRGAAIRPNWRR